MPADFALGNAYYFMVNDDLEKTSDPLVYGHILTVALTRGFGQMIVQYRDTASRTLRDNNIEVMHIYGFGGEDGPASQTNRYSTENPWGTLSGPIVREECHYEDDGDNFDSQLLTTAEAAIGVAAGVIDCDGDPVLMQIFTLPDGGTRYIALQDNVPVINPLIFEEDEAYLSMDDSYRPVSAGLAEFIERGLLGNVLRPMEILPGALVEQVLDAAEPEAENAAEEDEMRFGLAYHFVLCDDAAGKPITPLSVALDIITDPAPIVCVYEYSDTPDKRLAENGIEALAISYEHVAGLSVTRHQTNYYGIAENWGTLCAAPHGQRFNFQPGSQEMEAAAGFAALPPMRVNVSTGFAPWQGRHLCLKLHDVPEAKLRYITLQDSALPEQADIDVCERSAALEDFVKGGLEAGQIAPMTRLPVATARTLPRFDY